jgi:ParB-like chromosome segregation protein Spo0J
MGDEMTNWPADKAKRQKTNSLIPYARNSRTHSEQQVSQIAASIKEWGWTTPVLVDEDGGIIAGHGRVLAAQKLGIDEIPTIVATGWTKAQKAAYVLADNQLPQNAGWDMDLLSVEMKDLDSEGFDLSLIGFDDGMLMNLSLLTEEGLTDAEKEWEGMPEFDQGDNTSFRHVIVHFENNDDVKEFFSIIGQSHTDKTKSIWFPEQEKMDTESKRYG